MQKDEKKFNILYLVKTMDVGGAERFTLNLCKYIAHSAGSVAVLSSGGIFVKELERLGIKHIQEPLARSNNIRDLIKLRAKFKDIIFKENYKIIHCQHRVFVTLLNTLNLAGHASVIYTANNYFDDLFQKVIFPDYAVAISPQIAKNLYKTLLISPKKISRINYGVENTDAPVKAPAKKDKVCIGYSGRIVREKGIFTLLKAAEILYKQDVVFKLIIRGRGIHLSEVKEYISKNLRGRDVEILKADTGLMEIYNCIDVLVLPSEINEGLPLSVLEAMSRGIIVLASDKGAVSDAVKHNYSGFILRDCSASEVSNQLKFIIENIGSLSSIRKNAKNYVEMNFSMNNMLEKYRKLYNRISENQDRGKGLI